MPPQLSRGWSPSHPRLAMTWPQITSPALVSTFPMSHFIQPQWAVCSSCTHSPVHIASLNPAPFPTPLPPPLSLSFSLSQVCNVFLNLLAQVTAPLPFLFFKTQLSSYFLQKPSLTALVSEWCPYVYLVLRPLYSKLPAYTNLSV